MSTTAPAPSTLGWVASEDGAAYRAASPPGHDDAALEPPPSSPAGGDGATAGGAGADAAVDCDDGLADITGAPPALDRALKQLDAAMAALDEVELDAETDEAVAAASVELQRQVTRLQARVVRTVGEVDARQAYEPDGAVSAKQWFRARTHGEPGEAAAVVTASRRLRQLPRLTAAFADGRVTWAHTKAITKAAIPQRAAAIRALEDPLVQLAESALPQDVRTAVARIRDEADPDGSDASPLPDAGPDPRRAFTLKPGVDGLTELAGPLDPVTSEWLRTLLDAFDTPDGSDTPEEQRRTAAQRRHDALHDVLTKVAAHPDTPKLQGAKPRVLAMIDVATIAGVDCQAVRAPRLRYAGETSPELARQIAADARFTAVQTEGPWRPVSVGRAQRTLPAWLREVMHMLHSTCCGPDCDRPATWSEAHHLEAWGGGSETDLNQSVPACTAHHEMVTHGGWQVTMNPDTRVCTWTSPSGRVRFTHPPPL